MASHERRRGCQPDRRARHSLTYSDAAASKIKEWKQNGIEISAPFLLEYEVITILRKASAAGLLTGKDLLQSLDKIMTLRIQKIPPTKKEQEGRDSTNS